MQTNCIMKLTREHTTQSADTAIEGIRRKLLELGGRWTSARAKLVDAFFACARPLTIREAHRLSGAESDLVSTYRTVRTLQKIGALIAVDVTAEGERYELSDAHREHHHHLICTGCGSVEDFEDCFAEALRKKLIRRTRFKIAGHDFKFYGQCSECAA